MSFKVPDATGGDTLAHIEDHIQKVEQFLHDEKAAFEPPLRASGQHGTTVVANKPNVDVIRSKALPRANARQTATSLEQRIMRSMGGDVFFASAIDTEDEPAQETTQARPADPIHGDDPSRRKEQVEELLRRHREARQQLDSALDTRIHSTTHAAHRAQPAWQRQPARHDGVHVPDNRGGFAEQAEDSSQARPAAMPSEISGVRRMMDKRARDRIVERLLEERRQQLLQEEQRQNDEERRENKARPQRRPGHVHDSNIQPQHKAMEPAAKRGHPKTPVKERKRAADRKKKTKRTAADENDSDMTPEAERDQQSSVLQRTTAASRAKAKSAPIPKPTEVDPECTFKPQVTPFESAATTQTASLERRIEQWQAKHNTRMQQPDPRDRRTAWQETITRSDGMRPLDPPGVTQKQEDGAAHDPQATKRAPADRGTRKARAASERLYQEARRKAEQKRQQQQQKQQASSTVKSAKDTAGDGADPLGDSQECTFTPEINELSRAKASALNMPPLYHRAGSVQKDRTVRMHMMRSKAAEADAHLTFTPHINPVSEELARRAIVQKGLNPQADVVTRMTAEVASRVQKSAQRSAKILEEEEQLSFQPARNETSDMILQQNGIASKTFMERQHMYKERRLIRQRQHMRDTQQELTFRPSIGNADVVLANSSKKAIYEGETEAERTERLAHMDSIRKDEHAKRLTEAHYGQYTFQPRLSTLSKEIGKPKTVAELSSLEEAYKGRRKAEAKAEEKFAENHTFRPTLAPKTTKMNVSDRTLPLNDPERLTEEIAKRERTKARQAKVAQQEKERQELKDCTFTPVVNKNKAKGPEKPVLVRGLSSFLDNKKRAEQLKEEQQAHEDKVFMKNLPSKKDRATVPRPFQLSKGSPQGKRRASKAQQALQAEQDKECTFRPQTQCSQRKDLIERLLSTDVEEEEAFDVDADADAEEIETLMRDEDDYVTGVRYQY